MSYPVPSDESFADTVTFTKFDDEEKVQTKRAGNPYKHPLTGTPYESSYTNAVSGLSVGPQRLPSSIFQIPPFPTATKVESSGVDGRYHPGRNPYAYRPSVYGERFDLDSEEESDLAEQEELARRMLTELDAEEHPDPRFHFETNRQAKFRLLPDSPPMSQQQIPQTRVSKARSTKNHASTMQPTLPHRSRNPRTESGSFTSRSHQPPPSGLPTHRDMSTSYDVGPAESMKSAGTSSNHHPQQHHHDSRVSTPPFVMTPSITPIQTRSRSPHTHASQTARPMVESAPSVASVEESLPPPLSHHPHQHHHKKPTLRQKQREHVERIWKAEEELELINRRRILSAQLFEHETLLHQSEAERRIALARTTHMAVEEALYREHVRRQRWQRDAIGDDARLHVRDYVSEQQNSSVHSIPASAAKQSQSIPPTHPIHSSLDDAYHTPDGSIKETVPASGAAPAPAATVPPQSSGRLSVAALATPAAWPAQQPFGISGASTTGTPPVRPSQPTGSTALPKSSPGFLALSGGVATPSASLHPDDVPEHELAAYRSFVLRSGQSEREKAEQQAVRDLEQARGVDRLASSATVQRQLADQELLDQVAREREDAMEAERMREELSAHSQAMAGITSRGQAPRSVSPPLLPAMFQPSSAHPTPGEPAGKEQRRSFFSSRLQTTPPDSPRASGNSTARSDPRGSGANTARSGTRDFGSGGSTARSDATQEIDTHVHRASASPLGLLHQQRQQRSQVALDASMLLHVHGPLVRSLAVEERSWDARLDRLIMKQEFHEQEENMLNAARRNNLRRDQAERARAEIEQARQQIEARARSDAAQKEAELTLATRKALLRSEALADQTAEARTNLRAQQARDAAELAILDAALKAEQSRVSNDAAQKSRLAEALQQSLEAQKLVSERYAKFSQEAQEKHSRDLAQRNELLRLAAETKQVESDTRRVRWETERVTWNTPAVAGAVVVPQPTTQLEELKQQYRDQTGRNLDDPLSPTNLEVKSTSTMGATVAAGEFAADPDWKRVAAKVEDRLPASIVSSLPRVDQEPATSVANDANVFSAIHSSSDASSLRSQAQMSMLLDRLSRGETLPTGMVPSHGDFVPAFYDHLRSELAQLHQLQSNLASQQRALLSERLSLAQDAQKQFDAVLDSKEALRHDDALKAARRLETEEQLARAHVEEKQQVIQANIERIRASSRERQATKENLESLSEQAAHESLARRKSLDAELATRRNSLDALTSAKVNELEQETERKRLHLQELDRQLEEKRLALQDIGRKALHQPKVAAAASGPSNTSAVPIAGRKRLSPSPQASSPTAKFVQSLDKHPTPSIPTAGQRTPDDFSLDLSVGSSADDALLSDSGILREQLDRATEKELALAALKTESKRIVDATAAFEAKRRAQESDRERSAALKSQIHELLSPTSVQQSKGHQAERDALASTRDAQKDALEKQQPLTVPVSLKLIEPTAPAPESPLAYERRLARIRVAESAAASASIQEYRTSLRSVELPVTSPASVRPPSPLTSSLLNSSAALPVGSLADGFEAKVKLDAEQKSREVEKRKKETLVKTVSVSLTSKDTK